MKEDCTICGGSRIVRLPKRSSVSAFSAAEVAGLTIAPVEWTSAIYPCPECSMKAPQERVEIVDQGTFVSVLCDGDDYALRSARHSAAHRLIDDLIRRGYIRFTVEDISASPLVGLYGGGKRVRAEIATVTVAAAKQIAAQRLAEKQAYAAEVVLEAAANIENWGSYYNHSEILKRDAYRLIDDSVRAVAGRYKARAEQ